jgi:hypothetical protein
MPRNSGKTNRDLLSSHPGQNGKGSADRSPGWREHYDEINWGAAHGAKMPGGFLRFRKTYGKRLELHTPPNNYDEIFRKP